MGTLTPPTVDHLVQRDGTIIFSDHAKWAEVAAKVNMVIASSTSKALKAQFDEKISKIQSQQEQLSSLFMSALLKGLHISNPAANNALAAVLLCGNPQPEEFDWSGCQSTLQKLSDTNLRLLIQFDVHGTLGSECGKAFLAQLETLGTLFQLCSQVFDWLTLSLVSFKIRFSFVVDGCCYVHWDVTRKRIMMHTQKRSKQ